jgi:hypothetical protein
MTEYYIAAAVGALEKPTRAIKQRVIEALGSTRGTWSLTDDPHLTLQVGRTAYFEALLQSYRHVAEASAPFEFAVANAELHAKQGLIEIHASVTSPVLASLQQALLCASRPHLDAEVPRMYFSGNWDPEQAANIRQFHYPYAGAHFHPHVSIGRIPQDAVDGLRAIIREWRPAGTYVCERLDVFAYRPDDPTFAGDRHCSLELRQ